MVLAASTALTLTTNAVTDQNTTNLNTEISRVEAKIRNAASLQRYSIEYDATIIGNPQADPAEDENLLQIQIDFRDSFESAGYVVTWNEITKLWVIDWSETGVEEQVNVYSFRTTLAPGAVQAATITAIETYFDGLTPARRSRTVLTNNIDETEFAATASTFYEYTIVIYQRNDDVNHSSGLKTALIAAGLGYTNSNCKAYLMA